MRVAKFDIAYYRNEDVLLKLNQINDPKIALSNKSDTHVHFHLKFFSAYGFGLERETSSVIATTAASRSKLIEGAPQAASCVLDEAAPVILLLGMYRLLSLCALWMAGDLTWIEAPPLV